MADQCPGEHGLEGGESREGGCKLAVVPDEATLEVSKPQELLELFTKSGGRPLSYRLDLLRISPHLTRLDDESYESNRGYVKLTFLRLPLVVGVAEVEFGEDYGSSKRFTIELISGRGYLIWVVILFRPR